jgi:hypothetical protein
MTEALQRQLRSEND